MLEVKVKLGFHEREPGKVRLVKVLQSPHCSTES